MVGLSKWCWDCAVDAVLGRSGSCWNWDLSDLQTEREILN